MEMIEQGTANLKNVIVVPSGRFIISVGTFPEYFVKEYSENEKVDVTKDLSVFCEKVVPALRISKLFVGEEPTYRVTPQYYLKLREMLPSYGIEFKEVPRAELSGFGIISAAIVRQCIKDGDCDKLKILVPMTTYKIVKDKYNEG